MRFGRWGNGFNSSDRKGFTEEIVPEHPREKEKEASNASQ